MQRKPSRSLPHFLGSFGALAALMIVSPVFSAVDDWPSWRGAHKDGIAHEKGWTIDGVMKPLWDTQVGLGYSAVAIVDGRLYTMGFDAETSRDSVFCMDANTGDEVWKYSYPAEIWDKGHDGGTLSTPAVEGDRVYTKNREGKLFCFDAESGEVIWSKNVQRLYGTETGLWGYSSTPLIVEGLLIVDAGKTLAFDALTGDLVWETRDYRQAYSTPADFEHDGRRLLASFNASGLVILDAKTGEEITLLEWKTFNDINAATPIIMGDRIFISSGANHGCAMLRFDGEKLEVEWESKVLKTAMNGAVLWDDHLYGFDDSVLKCIDLDGNESWAERGTGLGAMIISDEKIVYLNGDGFLVFAQATDEGYRELARRPVFQEGKFWTMPVLVDGLIYCRNNKGRLVCLDHRSREN